MHTYLKAKDEQLWTVGHYRIIGDTDGTEHKWMPMRDFDTELEAATYVNFLNGGSTK